MGNYYSSLLAVTGSIGTSIQGNLTTTDSPLLSSSVNYQPGNGYWAQQDYNRDERIAFYQVNKLKIVTKDDSLSPLDRLRMGVACWLYGEGGALVEEETKLKQSLIRVSRLAQEGV